MPNSYVNQTWPIAGGGYALLTIVTPSALPAVALMALDPVVDAMETWLSSLVEDDDDG